MGPTHYQRLSRHHCDLTNPSAHSRAVRSCDSLDIAEHRLAISDRSVVTRHITDHHDEPIHFAPAPPPAFK